MSRIAKKPPRPASWLLQQCLPEDARENILGDLHEEYDSRSRAGVPATAWYLWHAVELSLRFLPTRWSERRAGDRNPSNVVDRLGMNLRFGLRMLWRQRAWTSLSVLTLGAGIGLTATAFSVVYGTLYRGLPLEDSNRLIHFERESPSLGRDLPVTPHDYVAWREQQTSFADLGAYVEAVLTLAGEDGTPERAEGLFISANSFDLLKTDAVLGRLLTADDGRPGAPAVMLIGHRVWRNRFAADPEVIGHVVRVNGDPTTIVGVMPPGFAFPIAEQYWLPLQLDLTRVRRGSGRLDVFGRLRPDASEASARAEFSAIGQRLQSQYPETNNDVSPKLTAFTAEYLGEDFPKLVSTMLLGAVLFLLIACANVGSLMSAQTTRRAGEMAIRGALGASRGQLVNQLLTETLVLSIAAGALGIIAARLGLAWFNRAWMGLADLGLPHGPDGLFWWRFELDAVPLTFVLLVTLASVALTGLFPLLHACSQHVGDVLQEETRMGASRRSLRMGSALVIAEVALTTGLLLAAGLTVQSALNVLRADFGFAVDHVFTARVGLPDERYPSEAARRQFWTDLVDRLKATPGVVAASAATTLPMQVSRTTVLSIRGEVPPALGDRPRVRTSTVDDDFFRTFQVEFVEGRPFGVANRSEREPVAIVNESFQRRYFPDGGALFRQIRVGHEDSDEPFRTVVGVVSNLWMEGSRDRNAAGVYLPLSQSRSPYGVGLRYASLSIRAPMTAQTVAQRLRTLVAELDSELPVYDMRPMKELIADGTGRYRLYGTFYMTVGVVALFLASTSLYGVLSFTVANSTTDIGIRMALGSGRAPIVRLYLGRGLGQVGAGGALGLLLAGWLGVGIRGALFDVHLWSPGAVAGVLLTLGASATLACYFPARRASLIAPMQALRR